MAGICQDRQQPAQEAECEEVVQVAFEAGFAFDRRGDVGLSTEQTTKASAASWSPSAMKRR